ncbi:MAG: AAA family ATPase [Pseudomonadales bacterium]|nr:AAA family ATPase [Pseudomonadales bacterium]
MYIQHFGLAQYPFSLTPNTRYFLKLPSHQHAFNQLIAALDEEGYFAKITGEVGTGKTMLCRKVLNSLEFHKDKFVTAYIPHPILSEEGIMHAIAEELSIERDSNISYYDLLKIITEEIVSISEDDKSVVFFIDEAQAMPEETLEAVHLLTRVESNSGKHMQVILFGQPELDELLDRSMLKQVKSQLTFSYQIPALDRDGVESYVAHRLSKAGYNGPHMFTTKAVDSLFEASKGIPRLINILCHKALMVAFGKGDLVVNEQHIENAITDTESTKSEKSIIQRLFAS